MLNLFISNAISFLLLTYLGNNLLESREMSKHKHVLIYLVFVTLLTILNGENVNLYNTLNLTIAYFLYLLCNYESKIQKKLIVLFSFILFIAIGEILASSISNLFLGLNSFSNISTFQYTLAILLSQTIGFLLLFLYIRLIKFTYWGELPKYVYLIIVFPITTILLLVNINDYFYLFRNNELLLLIIMGLLISNFVVIYVFLKTISALKVKNELETMKLEKKSIDFKYELLNAQYKANYTFMHDTIRAIMKMQNSLDKENYGLFKEELASLNKHMLRGLNIVNSNSSIISPIINFRLEEILKNEIDFKSVIEYTDFSFLDVYEQRFIFDTLLEIGMMQCNTSHAETKLMILKTKKLYQQVIIQLLTTHGEVKDLDSFTELYNKLTEMVHKHDGKISFECLNDSDSFIIIFNTELIN